MNITENYPKYALSGRMEIHPCVLQDIGPLGPLPCSHSTSSANHSKQGIGYRWPCAILGWLVHLRAFTFFARFLRLSFRRSRSASLAFLLFSGFLFVSFVFFSWVIFCFSFSLEQKKGCLISLFDSFNHVFLDVRLEPHLDNLVFFSALKDWRYIFSFMDNRHPYTENSKKK